MTFLIQGISIDYSIKSNYLIRNSKNFKKFFYISLHFEIITTVPNQIRRVIWTSNRKKCSLIMPMYTVGTEGVAHIPFCNLLLYHSAAILNRKLVKNLTIFNIYCCTFSASPNTGHHPQTWGSLYISSLSKTVLEISFCNFFFFGSFTFHKLNQILNFTKIKAWCTAQASFNCTALADILHIPPCMNTNVRLK